MLCDFYFYISTPLWAFGLAFAALMLLCVLFSRHVHKVRRTLTPEGEENWTLWSICGSLALTIMVIHYFKIHRCMENNYFDGPLFHGIDLLACYCCTLVSCVIFITTRRLRIPHEFATAPVPFAVSLAILADAHTTWIQALVVSVICIGVLAFAGELKRPQQVTERALCALLVFLAISGIAAQSMRHSTEEYFQRAEDLGLKRQTAGDIDYFVIYDNEEADSENRYAQLALSYDDWDRSAIRALAEPFGDCRRFDFYDVSCVRAFTSGKDERPGHRVLGRYQMGSTLG